MPGYEERHDYRGIYEKCNFDPKDGTLCTVEWCECECEEGPYVAVGVDDEVAEMSLGISSSSV